MVTIQVWHIFHSGVWLHFKASNLSAVSVEMQYWKLQCDIVCWVGLLKVRYEIQHAISYTVGVFEI